MSHIRIMTDLPHLIDALTEEIVTLASEAIKKNGRFSFVFSGGSTPRPLYENLAKSDAIDWQNVHIFFGDERFVTPDHADSNFRMASEALLNHVDIPESQIYRMKGELPPQEAESDYIEQLKTYFGDYTPIFDFVLLGMGDDAHTASLFPNTSAIHEHEKWVVAHEVPKLNTHRITLTPVILNQANYIAFMVDGENKAPALANVLQGMKDVDTYPSQIIKPTSGTLRWFVTTSSASQLK